MRFYKSVLIAFAGILTFFPLLAEAQTTIAVEDFDGGIPSWANDISSQTFVDPSSPAEGLFIQASTNIGSGSAAFGKDLGGETGEPTLSPYTFTLDPVDTSGFTNIEVSFDYYVLANADAGSYEIVVDGVGQGAVEFYNDPDTVAVSGTITATIGSASTVALILTGTLNGGSDILELDNFKITGSSGGIFDPTLFTASIDGSNNKSEIELTFLRNSNNDSVLIAINTEDNFGSPVNGISYSGGEILAGGGEIISAPISSSSARVTGLCPGKTYFFKAWSVDGGNNYSSGTAVVSETTNTYTLQVDGFSEWTVVDFDGDNSWVVEDDFASANGYQGDNPEEDWLISPEFDLTGSVSDVFEFQYRSNFNDPLVVGLEVFYTTTYTGDPGTTTWVPLTDINSQLDNDKSTGPGQTDYESASYDFSGLNNNSVRIGFKYTTGSTAQDARDWDLQNPLISGIDPNNGTINLTPGTVNLTEGNTTSLQITLDPAPATGTSITVCIAGDDDSQIVESGESDLSAKVIVSDSGTASITLQAVDNSEFDENRMVSVIANVQGYTAETVDFTIIDDETAPPSSNLVITEIMYNPAGDEAVWEWVEVVNTGSSNIDLSGYVLDDEDGSEMTEANVGSGVIPAGASAILYDGTGISASEFEDAWGEGAILIPVERFPALANGGEPVAIWSSLSDYTGDKAAQNNVVDRVDYGEFSFPNAGNGESIYLTGSIDSFLNDNGANWALATSSDIGSNTPVNSIRQSGSANGGSDFGSPSPDQPDITLLISPSSIAEDAGTSAASLTVSVSEIPGSYPLTIALSSDGDGSEVFVPASVTITSGTSVTIGLNAQTDGILDGNQTVEITGSATGYNSGSASVTVTDVDTFAAPGNVFISQYYSSASTGEFALNEVWIEICVPAGQTVDFSGYTLGIWSNEEREGWKSDSGTPATIDLSSLNNGNQVIGPATFLISDTTFSVNNPSYAIGNKAISDDTMVLADGNDSIVLYSGGSSVGNVVDAISTTDGNFLNNISLVRTTTATGIDFDAGSSYATYPGVWETETVANVNGATNNQNIYLGYCDLSETVDAGFTAFIDAQSGSGGTGPADDKNGNGIDNQTEYTFGLQADGTVANTAAGNSNVPFADLFNFEIVDLGLPATPERSDDRFSVSVELPDLIPSDSSIRVVASDIPNDDPETPTSANTRVLAEYDGATGTWMDVATNPGIYSGTVEVSGGISRVYSDKTIGDADRDFFYYLITIE